jgi:hypothetical protein
MSYLSAGVAPPRGWLEAKLEVLDRASKPKAALELVVVPSVRQLVVAASELPQLKTMSAQEWRTHVRTLAVEKAGTRAESR